MTEAYRFRWIFSSLYNSPISAPNRLADLLTFYYGDYTIKTTTNVYKMPVSTLESFDTEKFEGRQMKQG
jgi:hypothetical protein